MKTKLIASVIATTMLTACAPTTENNVLPTFDRLKNAAEAGQFMYAMQDGLCYGQGWHLEAGDLPDNPINKCDVKAVCGDFPAIAGFDLGGIEMADTCNLDGVDFDFMRLAAITHASRGGIVTFSWHLRNPLTGGTAWDNTSDKVVASILPEGEKHECFMMWLERLGDFLDSLRDTDGSLIPIIFRPWHENTGGWFWWGADQCSEEDYIALWHMVYDYLAVDRGLDSMVWAYSPSSTCLKEKAMGRYPGDDIIDLIGVDAYAPAHKSDVDQAFIDNMHSDLDFLSGIASEHGLLLALTETGTEGQDCPVWWTEELLPALEGYPVCYLLTWRNAWDGNHPGHWFSTYPGAVSEKDFVSFYESPRTLFLSDID